MDIPDGESMAGDGNMADIGNNSSHGTYGTYGYNGEYTHTDLGLQYLRARYYNMTTGTFTSRDTYGGTLTDILSQNRYTYAENNPVTYADPSGHFSIKNAWNKVKAGASAVRTVAKAAVSTVSSVVKKTYNAGALIAGDVIDSISGTCITAKHGNTASSRMAGSSLAAKSRTISRIGVTAGNFNNYMREQQNAAAEMENFKNFLNLGYGLNFERIAKTLPGTTPWAESIAAAVEQKKCQAYNYCVNVKQNMISERVDAGLGLLIKSWCEAVGGATLFVIGSVTWETGVGAVGMPLGLFGLASAISDASQAVQEIEYGLTGNKTAVSTNFLRDSLFKGNAKAYNNITNAVGGAGILAFTATYPILAGTTVILHGVAGQSSGEVSKVTPLLENSGGNELNGTTKTKLNYVTSNGLEIEATSGRTTTILGTYNSDTAAIIDELGNVKSLDFGPRVGGFNVLNTPDELYISSEQFWKEYNKPWLDNVVQRNDIIKIATEPTYSNLHRINNETGELELTGFGREFMYLIETYNYTYDPVTKTMIPPK